MLNKLLIKENLERHEKLLDKHLQNKNPTLSNLVYIDKLESIIKELRNDLKKENK